MADKYYIEFKHPKTGERRYVSSLTPMGFMRHTKKSNRSLLLTEQEVRVVSEGKMYHILYALCHHVGVKLHTIKVRITNHDPDWCELNPPWNVFIGWKR